MWKVYFNCGIRVAAGEAPFFQAVQSPMSWPRIVEWTRSCGINMINIIYIYVMDVWYVCCDWIMLKKLTYCEHLWTDFLPRIFQTKQPLHLHRRIPRSLHHISFSSWSCPYARLQDLRFATVGGSYVSKWAAAWYRTIIFNILWTYYEHIAIVYVTNDDRQALELWLLMFFWWFLCGCPMLSHYF